jgi:PAS domain-containing protein
LLPAAGLLLLHLTHLLGGQLGAGPVLWFAQAGVAVALVAWLGPRALALVAADSVLAWMEVRLTAGAPTWQETACAGWSAAVAAVAAGLAWWCYHHLARGARGLGDPRSAVLFLLLVSGLVTGWCAAAEALLPWLLGLTPGSLSSAIGSLWLGRALGILAVAPPLLAVLTPYLVRHGLVRPEGGGSTAEQHAAQFPLHPRRGDWIEVAGLVTAAGTFQALLLLVHGRTEPAGWQAWGVPLLLVGWASLRQGLRGGTLVAGTAAALPLVLLTWGWPAGSGPLAFAVQGNLLTQCSIALLAAASAGWIRASEARYRRVVGGIPVMLTSVRVDPSGSVHSRAAGSALPSSAAEISFISPACRELLGCEPEQLLGGFDGWLERVHPSDREVLLAAVAQLQRQDQPVTCEYRLAPDGLVSGCVVSGESDHSPLTTHHSPLTKERWVRDTLAPHHGPDGRLEGWEGVLTDITEQRALAGDLRRTTGMLHALVANLPAGVFFVQGRRPILVNARARQLLGQQEPTIDLDDLAAVYRLCRPDGSPYPLEDLPVTLALRRGLTSMRDDIVVHRSDGRRIPLMTWAAPIDLGGSGRPDAAVWVLEDASALRQAEAALRASEARLRAVIETMAEGLIVQDDQGAIVE